MKERIVFGCSVCVFCLCRLVCYWLTGTVWSCCPYLSKIAVTSSGGGGGGGWWQWHYYYYY